MKIIGVASISNIAVNVIWIPPAQPNGIITQYDVIYSEYDDTDNKITNRVTKDENSLIISQLGKANLALNYIV